MRGRMYANDYLAMHRRCTEARPMCFDHDSRPPIAPIKGGALDSGELTLTADDGNRFTAFEAHAARLAGAAEPAGAAHPTGAAAIILPDVRGLHAYYEDLALRFAENGIDAIAIDYFGRTAGLGRREAGFEYQPHVAQTTFARLSADIRAAAAHLRKEAAPSLFTVGFCFGGRISFVAPILDLDLAGAIGFYGNPVGERQGIPIPTDVAAQIASPVLGLFGGADQSIPPIAIEGFDGALTSARVEHRFVTYPDAPHSFFDRKADEYSRTSEAAWAEVLGFVRSHTAQTATA